VKPRLGQHFLTGGSFLARIASACPARSPLVVEIGAGRGELTGFLLSRADRLIAVELDAGLAAGLRERFAAQANVEILQADILDVALDRWGPVTIAGNLPYYITSPIIAKIAGLRRLLECAVLLVQKEVARRLTAAPGSRDYGFLTVRTQLFTVPEYLFPVPASAFRPPPQVDSAVVRLTARRDSPLADAEGFLAFASRCFRQKRKTLRNNLAADYPRVEWKALPESGLRAEQLSLEQLVGLFTRFHPASATGRLLDLDGAAVEESDGPALNPQGSV